VVDNKTQWQAVENRARNLRVAQKAQEISISTEALFAFQEEL
jgi:DNA/RNA endonuclease G (NUC1)